MSSLPRVFAVALGLTPLFASSAEAGWVEWGNPEDLRQDLPDVQITGRITGFKVTNPHGKTLLVTLPHPADLSAPLRLPEGTWREITLLLDGPVTVACPEGVLKLQVDSITVALEDPDAHQIHLDWTLPDDWTSLRVSQTRLLRALEDGALARP